MVSPIYLVLTAIVIGVIWAIQRGRAQDGASRDYERERESRRVEEINRHANDMWRARRAAPRLPESKPNFYDSWDEAMNRPVSGELFFIEYVDRDGLINEREIEPTMIQLYRGGGEGLKIVAFCRLRGTQRSFHSGKILRAVNLRTGRPIRDLGAYLRQKY